MCNSSSSSSAEKPQTPTSATIGAITTAAAAAAATNRQSGRYARESARACMSKTLDLVRRRSARNLEEDGSKEGEDFKKDRTIRENKQTNKMRRERVVAGEPCLSPIKPSHDKGLLADARQGNLQQFKKKLRNSIFKKVEDINQRDERHCTPLHYAAKKSHVEMIKFIASKGGDLSAQDKHGWSVLQYAVRYADLATAELLLEMGCDLYHKEKKGWSCLHLAARNGQPDKARLLLERGAEINEKQKQGWNSLHLAVRYGQPDTISILLEYGIDINATNYGWTALHLAALNGHTDIASILLNKGADLTKINAEGRTPLDIARQEKHDRIVAIILEVEFQNQPPEQVLPTPPPTPPSAPPLELIPATSTLNRNNKESLEEWRARIAAEIERLDVPQADAGEVDEAAENLYETLDYRITWKSLEEETRELMSQLESLRLREVNKIKKAILQTKDEHKQQLLKLDKQRHALEAKSDRLVQSVPRIGEDVRRKELESKEALREIDVLLENSRAESDLIEALKNQQMENRYSESAPDKITLLEQLETVQRAEVQQLQDARKKEQENAASKRREGAGQENLVRQKVEILDRDLARLEEAKEESKRQLEETLEELGRQLERAERRSMLTNAGAGVADGKQDERDEHWFGCPVCLMLLKPPMRIFQCPEGHILCEECKENPSMVHCPQCRCPLEGQCSRNRALEEVARSYFPMAPSETL